LFLFFLLLRSVRRPTDPRSFPFRHPPTDAAPGAAPLFRLKTEATVLRCVKVTQPQRSPRIPVAPAWPGRRSDAPLKMLN